MAHLVKIGTLLGALAIAILAAPAEAGDRTVTRVIDGDMMAAAVSPNVAVRWSEAHDGNE